VSIEIVNIETSQTVYNIRSLRLREKEFWTVCDRCKHARCMHRLVDVGSGWKFKTRTWTQCKHSMCCCLCRNRTLPVYHKSSFQGHSHNPETIATSTNLQIHLCAMEIKRDLFIKPNPSLTTFYSVTFDSIQYHGHRYNEPR
jgi:hypothetical protein